MNNNAWFKKENPLLSLQSMSGGAAGSLMQGASGPPKYVDEVFSTYLWEGNGSAGRTITNNIEKDKLVWIKNRDSDSQNVLTDTVRGANETLYSDSSNANYTHSDLLTAFTTDGFTVGSDAYVNESSSSIASWTFREREKFFDIVTYTGDGSSSGRQISHDLGSVPGLIIVKCTSMGLDWRVYHRSLGATDSLKLNSNAVAEDNDTIFADTNPTSTHFTVGGSSNTNSNTQTYVAYIFAHHDGDGAFGPDENKDIISCGTYTGNGSSTGPEINLGWEPQWILFKNADTSKSWRLHDSMRGIITGQNEAELQPNGTNTEVNISGNRISLTATGFKIVTTNSVFNTNGNQYVYMAIRRPDGVVGKPPSAGTDAFNVVYGNSSSTIPNFPSNFPVDMGIYKEPTTTYSWYTHTRLTGGKSLKTDSSDAQSGGSDADATFDGNAGWGKFGYNTDKASWLWKRGAGFDVCTYHLTEGGGTHTQNHSLGREPEMIWMKDRDNSDGWVCWHKGLNGGTNSKDYYIYLQGDGAESNLNNFWGTSASDINATSFYINQNFRYTGNHLAMLFASTDVSKVGYYTGNGATGQTITTGFQPRFVVIKNIDQSGKSWMVLDTLRGWAAGSEWYLQLNSTAAQTTHDFGAPTSNGFTLVGGGSTYNGSGTNYIYYAHA